MVIISLNQTHEFALAGKIADLASNCTSVILLRAAHLLYG